MIRPGREQLSGDVEVDGTLIGGLRPGNPSRQAKEIVIIAAEVRGKGIGRIRIARLPDEDGPTIVDFVKKNVAVGSRIISDGEWAYCWTTKHGYRHQRLPGAGHKELPRVHRIASLLKRWLLGTFQGRASPHQLEHYLDEYAFRFNRRNSAIRGQLFYRLLQQCAGTAPTPTTLWSVLLKDAMDITSLNRICLINTHNASGDHSTEERSCPLSGRVPQKVHFRPQ